MCLRAALQFETKRQTTPTEWQSFSERNVQEASEQVHRSLQLRVTSMAVMQDIIRDTRSHANQVDQLFHDVIDRTRKALGALKSEHNAVCQQIQDTEETASGLRAAIGAQDAPLGSAIQQLARRTARPNVEFCRQVFYKLLKILIVGTILTRPYRILQRQRPGLLGNASGCRQDFTTPTARQTQSSKICYIY